MFPFQQGPQPGDAATPAHCHGQARRFGCGGQRPATHDVAASHAGHGVGTYKQECFPLNHHTRGLQRRATNFQSASAVMLVVSSEEMGKPRFLLCFSLL